MTLHGLDIVVLLTVGATALFGAKRGFVAEVLALFAWVAMVFAVKVLHLPVSERLAAVVGTTSGAAVLAFALVTGVTYVLSKLVVNAVGRRTRTSVLGPIDRALGFGFGALKGLILASLAFILLALVLDTLGGGPSRRPAWVTEARTYPLLRATSGAIADFVDRRRKGLPVFPARDEPPPTENRA
jgi:membrane protein required for colicin V production